LLLRCTMWFYQIKVRPVSGQVSGNCSFHVFRPCGLIYGVNMRVSILCLMHASVKFYVPQVTNLSHTLRTFVCVCVCVCVCVFVCVRLSHTVIPPAEQGHLYSIVPAREVQDSAMPTHTVAHEVPLYYSHVLSLACLIAHLMVFKGNHTHLRNLLQFG
jgi:hypothetical protein